jgi:ribosomal protein S3AE
MTRVTSPVQSGAYALKVAQLGTVSSWFTVDTWPQVVAAHAGTTYTATVYVAAPPSWVGRTVDLVLRESVHDAKHSNEKLWVKSVTLTSSYQLVQVSGQAVANDTVSAYVGPPSSPPAGTGEYFYVDVLTLTAG